MAKELNIIHFNDVYEINERKKEPIGGAARYVNKHLPASLLLVVYFSI